MSAAAEQNLVRAKRIADEEIHGLHPNTQVPLNWRPVGVAYQKGNLLEARMRGLDLKGPEMKTIYTSDSGWFVDACGFLLSTNRLWHTSDNTDGDAAIWVRGPYCRVLSLAEQREWNEKWDAKNRTWSAWRRRRSEAQRRSREQRLQHVARARARPRLVNENDSSDNDDEPAPESAPAPGPEGYNIDDLARILGVEPAPAPARSTGTVAETALAALETLNSALRPLRSAPVPAQAVAAPVPAQAVAAPVAAQAVAAPVAAQAVSLETALDVVMKHLRPNQPEEEKRTCCICMDAAPDTVFTACGHVCACAGCAERLQGSGVTWSRKCPICRRMSKPMPLHFV